MSELMTIAREGQLLEAYRSSLAQALQTGDLDAVRDALDDVLIVIAHTQSDILRAKALRVITSFDPALSEKMREVVQRCFPPEDANTPDAH